jgi:osmoprotectant transport system permease protein
VTTVVADTVIPSFEQPSECVRTNGWFCTDWVRAHWGDTLGPALVQHIELSAIAVAVGFALAFALALAAYHWRILVAPIGLASDFLYTIPSLALFQLLVPVTGLTTLTIEIALVSYTLLILFQNTLAGLQGVPEEVRDAARGMGLTRRQLLWRIEVPLALPTIVAGLRIAAVSTISIATIAALVVSKGLGRPIFDAIQTNLFRTEILAAGGLTILLALACDALLVLALRALTPWSRRRAA